MSIDVRHGCLGLSRRNDSPKQIGNCCLKIFSFYMSWCLIGLFCVKWIGMGSYDRKHFMYLVLHSVSAWIMICRYLSYHMSIFILLVYLETIHMIYQESMQGKIHQGTAGCEKTDVKLLWQKYKYLRKLFVKFPCTENMVYMNFTTFVLLTEHMTEKLRKTHKPVIQKCGRRV